MILSFGDFRRAQSLIWAFLYQFLPFLRIFLKHKSVNILSFTTLCSPKIGIISLWGGYKQIINYCSDCIFWGFYGGPKSKFGHFLPKNAKFGLWTPVKSQKLKIINFCK